MDAFEWTAGVYATAMAMAKCMDSKELTRSAPIFTQLGTTLCHTGGAAGAGRDFHREK